MTLSRIIRSVKGEHLSLVHITRLTKTFVDEAKNCEDWTVPRACGTGDSTGIVGVFPGNRFYFSGAIEETADKGVGGYESPLETVALHVIHGNGVDPRSIYF
jgi:hypothetical protein